MTDTRDVIARALAEQIGSGAIKGHWYEEDADAVLAALAAAGKTVVTIYNGPDEFVTALNTIFYITETPAEWEWAHRSPDGEIHGPMPSESIARALQDKERGFSRGSCGLARRRSAGPWEIAP